MADDKFRFVIGEGALIGKRNETRATLVLEEDPTIEIEKQHAAALAELRDLEQVEKTAISFLKRADEQLARTWDFIKTAHEASGLNFCDFTDTENGHALANAYYAARDAMLNPAETIAKQAAPVIARLEQEVDKRVEEFSIAHNLDAIAARHRLETISPSFNELVAKHHDAIKVRDEAVRRMNAHADNYHAAKAASAAKAQREAAVAADRERAQKRMTPSERKLMDVAEKRAQEQKVSVGKALNDLLETDAGRALHDLAREERARGVR